MPLTSVAVAWCLFSMPASSSPNLSAASSAAARSCAACSTTSTRRASTASSDDDDDTCRASTALRPSSTAATLARSCFTSAMLAARRSSRLVTVAACSDIHVVRSDFSIEPLSRIWARASCCLCLFASFVLLTSARTALIVFSIASICFAALLAESTRCVDSAVSCPLRSATVDATARTVFFWLESLLFVASDHSLSLSSRTPRSTTCVAVAYCSLLWTRASISSAREANSCSCPFCSFTGHATEAARLTISEVTR